MTRIRIIAGRADADKVTMATAKSWKWTTSSRAAAAMLPNSTTCERRKGEAMLSAA
jgi:hypothetical protein